MVGPWCERWTLLETLDPSSDYKKSLTLSLKFQIIFGNAKFHFHELEPVWRGLTPSNKVITLLKRMKLLGLAGFFPKKTWHFSKTHIINKQSLILCCVFFAFFSTMFLSVCTDVVFIKKNRKKYINWICFFNEKSRIFFWAKKHNSVKKEREKGKFNLKIFIKTLYGMALCDVEKGKKKKKKKSIKKQ